MELRGATLSTCFTILVLVSQSLKAQQSPPARQPDPARVVQRLRAAEYKPPEDVSFRSVTILSDGIRLHGEVFTPKATSIGKKLPAIVMAHGWGGVAAGLRDDAVDIARAGYLVLVFDYRGWGESASPVVLIDQEATHKPGEAAPFSARVQPLREYINPLEQAEDWFSALDWLVGEPQVDANRIGIRGSSYSGGHVVYVAAHDPRVNAVVSQVGGFNSRPAAGQEQPGRDMATKMARGELGYPAPRASAIKGLIGSPIGRKGERYAPVDEATKVNSPTLIILVENEEYGGNPVAMKAYEALKGPKKLEMLPGVTHYAVYSTEREKVIRMATQWFDQYLK
jgi:dienelactone hydrolase